VKQFHQKFGRWPGPVESADLIPSDYPAPLMAGAVAFLRLWSGDESAKPLILYSLPEVSERTGLWVATLIKDIQTLRIPYSMKDASGMIWFSDELVELIGKRKFISLAELARRLHTTDATLLSHRAEIPGLIEQRIGKKIYRYAVAPTMEELGALHDALLCPKGSLPASQAARLWDIPVDPFLEALAGGHIADAIQRTLPSGRVRWFVKDRPDAEVAELRAKLVPPNGYAPALDVARNKRLDVPKMTMMRALEDERIPGAVEIGFGKSKRHFIPMPATDEEWDLLRSRFAPSKAEIAAKHLLTRQQVARELKRALGVDLKILMPFLADVQAHVKPARLFIKRKGTMFFFSKSQLPALIARAG
jgi:hypothetical protein